MSEDNVGVDLKRLGIPVGLMVATTLVVTLVYWGIFGFDVWEEEMGQAADLMMAASVAPIAAPTGNYGTAGQYVCPRDGASGLPNVDGQGLPHCPVCGQVMNFFPASPQSMTLAAAGAG